MKKVTSIQKQSGQGACRQSAQDYVTGLTYISPNFAPHLACILPDLHLAGQGCVRKFRNKMIFFDPFIYFDAIIYYEGPEVLQQERKYDGDA